MNFKLMIFGAIIGIANIIPGVSGGTMAVILNIYDKLIASISNLRTDLKASLKFLIPIGIGGGVGVLLFSKFIEYTLNAFPVATNLVFIGLIVGTVPLIWKKSNGEKVSMVGCIVFILTLTLMIYLAVVHSDEQGMQVMTNLTISNFIKLFLTSIIAAGAMIIPGLSGSFMLLLFGTYATILTAVSDLNILILCPVGLGCIVGVLLCAKGIDYMFNNYEREAYSGVLGLMVGSIFTIFPSFIMNLELFLGVVFALIAGVLAYKMSK